MILLIAFGDSPEQFLPLSPCFDDSVPCNPHVSLPLLIHLVCECAYHERVSPESCLDGAKHLTLNPLVLIVMVFEEFVDRVLVLMSHSFETADLKQAVSSDLMQHIVDVVSVHVQLAHSRVLLPEAIPLKHGLLGHVVLLSCFFNCILDNSLFFGLLPLAFDLIRLLPPLLLNELDIGDGGDELTETVHGLFESGSSLQLAVDELQDIEVDFLMHLEGASDSVQLICQLSHVLLRDKLLGI